MLGVGEDLLDAVDLDDLAGAHHGDAVGELGHQPHVVADQDHRGADIVLDLAQGLHDAALDDDIKGTGRFVGDDDAGAEADGGGDADALLHTAAELVRKEVGDFGFEVDSFE